MNWQHKEPGHQHPCYWPNHPILFQFQCQKVTTTWWVEKSNTCITEFKQNIFQIRNTLEKSSSELKTQLQSAEKERDSLKSEVTSLKAVETERDSLQQQVAALQAVEQQKKEVGWFSVFYYLSICWNHDQITLPKVDGRISCWIFKMKDICKMLLCFLKTMQTIKGSWIIYSSTIPSWSLSCRSHDRK